ncbi:MAG TPA: glycosyltransferase [Thermoleophilaceae bacterium]
MRRDLRLSPPTWRPLPADWPRRRLRLILLVGLNLLLAFWYFSWLARPERIGMPLLFGLLIAAELFNLFQAVGFWWTGVRGRRWISVALPYPRWVDVDVFVPVYGEPAEIVEPTIEAATKMRGAEVQVWLLDDGASDEMEALAERHGARYLRRPRNHGAKAGNINNALRHSSAPYVVVLDSDHVPHETFLEKTLGHMCDRRVAFVQTPQYYANHDANPLASAAWAQQALFFGAIAHGKDGIGATFCCGTNVLFRREALEDIGGFPEESLTEDFELSIEMHSRGWKSAYVPEVLASGLGPEDMASYVSQQQRWARGCLSAFPKIVRTRLPLRLRLQYFLSAMYFLSGWTVLVYMSFPVVRILTGEQPLAAATANQFLLHFAPYFACALLTVAVAGGGAYTFGGFALAAANFWIHILSTLLTVTRRRGRFVVTPKKGVDGPQPRTVLPALVAVLVLLGVALYGLSKGHSPATLNNVAFAGLHVFVLMAGVWPALIGARAAGRAQRRERERERAAAEPTRSPVRRAA